MAKPLLLEIQIASRYLHVNTRARYKPCSINLAVRAHTCTTQDRPGRIHVGEPSTPYLLQGLGPCSTCAHVHDTRPPRPNSCRGTVDPIFAPRPWALQYVRTRARHKTAQAEFMSGNRRPHIC